MTNKVLRCHCTKTDQPFDVTFAQNGATLRIAAIEAVKPGRFWTWGKTKPPAAKEESLEGLKIDWTNFQCAWCGSKGLGKTALVACGECGREMCLGRSHREAAETVFVCSEACGMKSKTATRQSPLKATAAALRLTKQNPTALPSPPKRLPRK